MPYMITSIEEYAKTMLNHAGLCESNVRADRFFVVLEQEACSMAQQSQPHICLHALVPYLLEDKT